MAIAVFGDSRSKLGPGRARKKVRISEGADMTTCQTWSLQMFHCFHRSSGNGRVVTCCRLERLFVERDAADEHAVTSARRLILSHDGSDVSPPGLFLFEETPSIQDEGPSVRLKQWRSSLDVWFEDSKSVDLAFKTVAKVIDGAKAVRGNLLQKYLAQGEGSGYPTDVPAYRHTLEDTI